MHMPTRLERSTTNKVIAGVCGGIAEYIQVDPTLVRVFFVIAAFGTAGLGVLGYIVLLILMPLPGKPTPFVSSSGTAPSDPANPDAAAQTTAPVVAQSDPAVTERRRTMFGYFLVALGAIFLLSNLGAFHIVRWDLVWPIVIVGAGVLLLMQRVRQ